jgi:hypothetical protein
VLSGEARYLVLPAGEAPYLLARVRWPDIAQAISPAHPDWLDDPGLFELPYEPSASVVSFAEAAAIAASWGASLPESPVHQSGPALIRRMPANWSKLTPAEMEFWSLQLVVNSRQARRRTAAVGPQGAADSSVVGRAPRWRPLAALMWPFRRRRNRIGPIIIDLKEVEGGASGVQAVASANHAEAALADVETSNGHWSQMGAGGQ